ncbi:putative glycosyl transferase [Corynebacterium occultum]|uniref:Putative glycosyl transferase n=1 Tax=Corynebacterium occultum TaxID=2675219 RepID=A0A6B8WQD4_9CORY|nr:glycosyltransferase family 4 protein [Corynebacterium occultum]QGU08468.1 putative glycosyl transferase [Corynebacterium occultum]
MKILVLSQYWHPENGVPQRRWTWLSKILSDAGHEVTVIAPPPHYLRNLSLREWWKERKFSSHREPGRGQSGELIIRSGFVPSGSSLTQKAINQSTVALGSLWVVLKRPGVLKGYRPDLIIGTVPALPTALTTWLSAWILCSPYVIDLRDNWPELLDQAREWNKGTGQRSLREKLLSRGPLQAASTATRFTMHRVLAGAAGIVVTSGHLRRDLLEGQPANSEREVITVRNVFPPETDYVASGKDEGSADSLNVLYAGTLGRAQNLANALEAAYLAEQQGLHVHLRFVGAGATKKALVERAKELGVEASFESRRPADALEGHYEWADTALVHLTDWEPLGSAVPSKTYELMAAGLHISGVINGETAELIREHQAGDIVEAEDPQALADLWVTLAKDRSRLRITGTGQAWVAEQREHVVPPRLLGLVERTARP